MLTSLAAGVLGFGPFPFCAGVCGLGAGLFC